MLFLTLAGIVGFAPIVSAQSGCLAERLCLKVVSQRWLTKTDLAAHDPMSSQRIAVRLRLSNETGHEIMYLTGLNSIAPLGYRYSRKVGEPQWTFLPKTKDRSERLFRLSGISGNYVYLRLPANSGVEFEIPDWASSREKLEEHAFSVFIKFDDNENTIVSVELTSEIFYPLVRETAVFETISPTRSYSWASVILTL